MYTASGKENYLLYCLEHGVIHKENTLYKRNYLESAVYHAYNNFTGQKKPYPLENVYKVLMMAPVKESNMPVSYTHLLGIAILFGFAQWLRKILDLFPSLERPAEKKQCGI